MNEESCIVCGDPPDYCQGGHGEPCPTCRGWVEPEGGESHEWTCLEQADRTLYGVLALPSHGVPTEADDFLYFADPQDVDIAAHVYICEVNDEGETDSIALSMDPDPYPDYTTNGFGGWSLA